MPDLALILLADLSYLAIVIGLALGFRLQIAIIAACIGGQLLLPREAIWNSPEVSWYLGKSSFIAVAILLALGIHYQEIRRFRFSWFDLAPFLFSLSPLLSVIANQGENWNNGVAISVDRILTWGIPYFAGRICFQTKIDQESLRQWLLYGTLAITPLFVWEAFLGKDYYLSYLLYGIPPYKEMTWRLGGWRPELFFRNGIECGTWLAGMCIVAISALWDEKVNPRRKYAKIGICVVLLLMLLFSRTVYAYAVLIGTLPFFLLSLWLRRPYVLCVLVIGVSTYCATRSTGLWDGQGVVRVVENVNSQKTGSVAYRFRAEDAYAKKVREHGPIWGFGGTNSAIYDWWAKNHLWPDGWWVHVFRSGGYVGLIFWIGLFGVVPVVAAMPSFNLRLSSLMTPSTALLSFSCFAILNLVDGLHNMAIFGTTGMLLGALVSNPPQSKLYVSICDSFRGPLLKWGAASANRQRRGTS